MGNNIGNGGSCFAALASIRDCEKDNIVGPVDGERSDSMIVDDDLLEVVIEEVGELS